MSKYSDHHILLKILAYFKVHKVFLGSSLATYGIFYLSSVIISGWTIANWGENALNLLPFSSILALSSTLLNPLFFVTSFPSLIFGTIILSVYCLTTVKSGVDNNKAQVAIFLIIFGFAYQVIGAWPLGITSVFQWEWQKQIINLGIGFAWILTLLSLIALITGSISLFIHSKLYHQRHPEFRVIKLEN